MATTLHTKVPANDSGLVYLMQEYAGHLWQKGKNGYHCLLTFTLIRGQRSGSNVKVNIWHIPVDIKLPFYLGRCSRSRWNSKIKVRVKGRAQRSMSNVWDIAVDKVTNQVLTFLELNENEKKKWTWWNHKRSHSVRGLMFIPHWSCDS